MAVCIISGMLKKVNGEPLKEARVYFSIPRYPVATSDKEIVSTTEVVVLTDDTGTLTIPLMQGIVIKVTSHDAGIKDKEFIVPSTTTADLADLL